MDFKIAHENGDGLLKNWQQCADKILTFLFDHVKERNIRGLIEKLKNDDLPESMFCITFLVI